MKHSKSRLMKSKSMDRLSMCLLGFLFCTCLRFPLTFALLGFGGRSITLQANRTQHLCNPLCAQLVAKSQVLLPIQAPAGLSRWGMIRKDETSMRDGWMILSRWGMIRKDETSMRDGWMILVTSDTFGYSWWTTNLNKQPIKLWVIGTMVKYTVPI